MTTTEIREALAAVEQAVDVPPVDRIAFQARVRTERRRRTAGRALVGVAAAAAVVAAGVAGDAVLREPERSSGPGLADQPREAGVLSETVYFTVDNRLVALDAEGSLHESGLRSGGAVGWTGQRVYAVDMESEVVVYRVRNAGGSLTFTQEASPVSGPVQRVEMSGDRRYLAWLDNDNVVHRYDLKSEQEDVTIPVSANTLLTGVAAEGVLLSEDGALSVRDDDSSIPIPVRGDADSFAPDIAFGLVLVNDRDGRARLYSVREGSAQLVTEMPGAGELGPFGERVATIVEDPADRAHVEMWDGVPMGPVTGLDGVFPVELRWAGESTLLVSGDRDGGPVVYACDIDLRCEQLPVDGAVNLDE
jgi:hypothetical protein